MMQEDPGYVRKATPILLASLLAGLYLHYAAGLYFPIPVVDEALFYYMAQGIHVKNLLANHWVNPHLNAVRELFCMPPGYMLLLAGWLKLAGASLVKARWLSFALAGLAFLLWSRAFRKWGLCQAGLVLLCAAFLSRHWVVMANFTRMEGLELCLWALGLLSLRKGNKWAALSWFLLSVCVHPNGVYFCVFWLGWQVWEIASLRKNKIPFDPHFFRKIGHLAPGLLAATGYALHVAPHWAAFVQDWQFQLSTRRPGGISLLLMRPDQAGFLLVWAGCAVLIYRNPAWKHWGMPLLAAATLWLMRLLGQGWSYGVFNVLAVTVVGAIAVNISVEIIPDIKSIKFWKKGIRAMDTLLVIGLLMATKVYSVPGLWATYEWQGMLPQAAMASPYIQPNDISAIREKLHMAGRLFRGEHGRPARIYTLPEAEGAVLGSGEADSWQHVLPIMPDIGQAKGNPQPDYILWHKEEMGSLFESSRTDMAGVCTVDTLKPFYARIGPRGMPEATWYLVPLRGALPPFILRAFTPVRPRTDSEQNPQ